MCDPDFTLLALGFFCRTPRPNVYPHFKGRTDGPLPLVHLQKSLNFPGPRPD